MTAIVGVLNKHAVAIAADSAATISNSNNQKVFNTANKVFTLSKYHPVSIAIYNNSELIGVPWEIVIKEYRKNLDEKGFDTLQQYVDNFFEFLAARCYFSNDEGQKLYLSNLIKSLIAEILFSIRGNNPAFDGPPLAAAISDNLDKIISNTNKFGSFRAFENFTKEDFSKYLSTQINEILSDLSEHLNVVLNRDKFETAVYQMFTRMGDMRTYSGIVFCGFGEAEIFPSIQSYKVLHAIDNKLAVITDKKETISLYNPVLISPFAQIDVMQTLIDGVSPVVKDIYFKGLTIPIKALLMDIAKKLQPNNLGLSKNILNFIKKDLGNYINSYIDSCDRQRIESYTAPFVNSVAALEKEDLADFAESLISITSVKRKMNLNEQNTVGGPVDVLVLSKGDGAVWMKRKHYFDPALNPNFFNIYLKH